MSEVYYGIYQGIVTKTNDPEKRGRIKCQIPSVLGNVAESAWCDPVIPVAYDGGGDFCIPQTGEAVWILFIEGNQNMPVWFGGWWSKNKTPIGDTYTNLNDLRIISYANCTIVMQNGIISLSVGGNNRLVIDGSTITLTGDVTIDGNLSVTGTVN